MSRSYASGWVATLVGSPTVCVGIDIERSDRALPQGFLSEQEELFWLDGEALPPRIAAACIKEACGKALGFGLLARWELYRCAVPQKVGSSSWKVEFPAFPLIKAGTAVTKDGSLVVAVASMRPALSGAEVMDCLMQMEKLDAGGLPQGSV